MVFDFSLFVFCLFVLRLSVLSVLSVSPFLRSLRFSIPHSPFTRHCRRSSVDNGPHHLWQCFLLPILSRG